MSQKQVTITEALDSTVNVKEGVIEGAKLIGFNSKNGRYYPPTVLKSAVALYEGAKVNIDHPDGDPTKPRKYDERFGVIRNARFVEGKGVFGDCHFNPEHHRAKQVCWDAKNNPEALGFSHNALLKLGGTSGGRQTVESIVSIRSMDLVADPATTHSLFESEDPSKMDVTNPDPAQTSTDPKATMKAAFRQMVIAAFDDPSLDTKATMKKIAEIMKAQSKLTGDTSPMEDPATDTDAPESIQLRQQVGLLTRQLEQYQIKEKQAQLVESINSELSAAGLDPKNTQHVSDVFSKQLLATESVDARKALIADRASLVGATSKKPGGGGSPSYKPTTSNATEQIDAKSFASRLLS